MSDDHAKRALEMLEGVRDAQATERGLRIAEAQVYATLALVEVLAPPSPEARATVRRPAWVDAQRQEGLRSQRANAGRDR